MKSGLCRFNIYLAWVCLTLALGGCQSPKSQHQHVLSALRVHLEAPADGSENNQVVQVFREHPVSFNIQKDPFLNEGDISQAKVVDALGGFELRIEFDRQGKWLLEQHSAANPGRHLVIYSQFKDPKDEKRAESRWLAAPKITRRIADGVLTFAPDATRQEAEEIALGLNHVAGKFKAYEKW